MKFEHLEYLAAGLVFVALVATEHYCSKPTANPQILSEPARKKTAEAVRAIMRSEHAIQAEQERKRIKSEIDSMFMQPYRGGC